MLDFHIGTDLALTEIALDITPWGDRQVNPSHPVMCFPIKAGMASHSVLSFFRKQAVIQLENGIQS
jgi:hypothetical protein